MPWYVPAILIPAFLLGAFYGVKAVRETVTGSDKLSLLAIGIWARDEHFTPAGRRYRMWSLCFSGGGVLLVVLIYLARSLK